MINPQWLELPMSRTNSYGPKDVRAIEVRLYVIRAVWSTHSLFVDVNSKYPLLKAPYSSKLDIVLSEKGLTH